MCRYIDFNLIGELVDSHGNVHYEDLQNLPTADVVEVVRCKECVGFHNGIFKNNVHKKFCSIRFTFQGEKFVPLIVTENDYCSYGKRKDKR